MNGRVQSPGYVIEDAEQVEWRCICIIRPLFAMYTILGGVHIKITGRHAHPLHYVHDLRHGALLAHCPACHRWMELTYDDRQITEREYSGERPGIDCPCTTERG